MFSRVQLLRKIVSFAAPIQDLKQIYIRFVRSMLEQSATTVWHSSLSMQNITDTERVRKSAFKLILGEKMVIFLELLKIYSDLLNINTFFDVVTTVFHFFLEGYRYKILLCWENFFHSIIHICTNHYKLAFQLEVSTSW